MKGALATSLLTRGDDQRDSSPRPFSFRLSNCGRYKSRNASLHVAGTAPEQLAIADVGGKGRRRPGLFAKRHNVEMSGECERRQIARPAQMGHHRRTPGGKF